MVRYIHPILIGAGLALAACGGSSEEPETPQQPTPQPYQYPPPAGQPQQTAPGQYPPAQPGAVPPPAQPGVPPAQPGVPAQPGGALPGTLPGAPPAAPPGSPAQQLDPSLAAPVQSVLNQMAATEAPGAQPLGSVMAGNFQQGQTLQAQIQMQPGKCYTVVAAALIPVTEVNIQLTAVTPVPGLSSPILAQDQSTGLQAVLGQNPNCYKWAWPVAGPVNVVLTVAGGSGLAAAQVYVK